MKKNSFIILLFLASCTTALIKSEEKFLNSEWLVEEAYIKSNHQKMPIEGAKLKFLNDKVVILNQNNEEYRGTWQTSTVYVDEYGTALKTIKVEIKNKKDQKIFSGQSENFKKQAMTLRGNVNGKTSIFKLKMIL